MKIDVQVWRLEDLVAFYTKSSSMHQKLSEVDCAILNYILLDHIRHDEPIGCFCLLRDSDSIYGITDGLRVLSALTSVLLPSDIILYYNYVFDTFEQSENSDNISLSMVYSNRSLFAYIKNHNLTEIQKDLIRDLHHKLHTYKVPCYVLYQPRNK